MKKNDSIQTNMLINHESEQIHNSQILETIFRFTSDAVLVLDEHNHVFLTNQAFEKAFGWKLEEIKGKKIPIIPLHLLKEAEELANRVERGEEIVNYETVRVRKDGRPVQIHLSMMPLRNHYGKVIGNVCMLRDISDLKMVKAELQEMSALHKMITENLLDVITILDRNERIIYSSPSFEKMFGYAMTEKTNPFAHIYPKDVKRLHHTFKQIMQTKKPASSEIRAINKDGAMIYLEVHGMPVIGEEKEVEYVVVTSRDITDRMRTEELLRNNEKIAMAGVLAASIAHEIRNPLTSLIGFVQLFQKNGFTNPEHLEIMKSELDRINLIVNELLLFAKPQETEYKLIDLQQVIDDVLNLMQSQANMSNTLFNINCQKSPIYIHGESNQLKQVFINIIKNGIEAMPQGGELTIETKLIDGHRVVVKIQDEGTGISEELLSKLGNPFFTTKDRGSGLGLMISKKIIQDHQGNLVIRSIKGTGTVVEIDLPLSS